MRRHPIRTRRLILNTIAFTAGAALVVIVHLGALDPVATYLSAAAAQTRVVFLVIVAALLGIVALASTVLALRYLEHGPRR